jgi:hypothetical protein
MQNIKQNNVRHCADVSSSLNINIGFKNMTSWQEQV